MKITSISAKVGNVSLDEGSAKLLSEVLGSDNPAANWNTRLLSIEAILPVMPEFISAFNGEMLTVEVTGEDEKRGNVIKTVEVRVNDVFDTILKGIQFSCQTAKLMDNAVTYRDEVENPSEGKRGRKAFARTFVIPTRA